MDTEKEIRVRERGLDERGRTYLPQPGHYPRALKRCEWIHSFWEYGLSSCLSLVSEGIQLLIVERAEVELESGQDGGRMHGVETYGRSRGSSTSFHIFIQTMDIKTYLTLLPIPRNGSQHICEFDLKSAIELFLWGRIKSRIMSIKIVMSRKWN